MHSGSDFKNPSFIVFEDDNELFLLMELPLTKPVVAICLFTWRGFTARLYSAVVRMADACDTSLGSLYMNCSFYGCQCAIK